MVLEQPTMAKRRNALTSQLNDAYTWMVDRIRNSSSLSDLGMRVLMWLHLATRPLGLIEIQHALAVELGDIELDEEAIPSKKRLLDCCLGLVLVDEETSTVQLVHYTLEEYFQMHSNIIFPHSHSTVAEICLTYLSLGGLNIECETHIDMMQQLGGFPFLEYAAYNWGGYTALAQDHTGIDLEGHAALAMNVLCSKSTLLPHIALQVLYFRITGAQLLCFWHYEPNLQLLGVHAAAYFGLETYMPVLGTNQGWDVRGAHDRSPLSFAASGGQEAVVRLLVARNDVAVA